MDTEQIMRLLVDGLLNFGAFVILVTATVIVFILWKRKEGGALGAFLLMLARTGVWLVTLGFLVVNMLMYQMDPYVMMWLHLGLRVVLLLSTLFTIVAFLLMKPARTMGGGEVHHG